MSTNKTISPAKRFWLLLKPDQREITNLYIYSIFNGMVYLSLPLGIQAIINLIQGGQMSTSWVILVILVIAGIALSGMLQIYQLKITEMLQQKIFTRAAFEFSYRLPRIKEDQFAGKYAPELMNRFFDTIAVQKGLSKLLIDFSTAIIQMSFGLILLAIYHPVFLVFSLATALILWLIFRYSFSSGMQSSLKESKYKYNIANWLEEIARHKKTFKMASNSPLYMEKTNTEVTHYLEARDSHFAVLLKQYGLMILFKVIIATGLLAIGGVLVLEQQMNIGQFVAAEIIILLIMSSAEKLVLSMEVIYDVLTALEKMGQVTDMELEREGGLNFIPDQHSTGIELEIKQLVYQAENKAGNLVNINLSIKAGECIQIRTKNEIARKSLAELITGNVQSESGSILINEVPIQNIDLARYRSKITYISRNDDLIDASLLENITLKRPGITVNQLTQLVTQLGLNSFVESLPEGYQTNLRDNQVYIPQTVSKKIILARNLIHQPSLILAGDIFHVFDEADKQNILQFLFHPAHGWSILFLNNDEYIQSAVSKTYCLDNAQLSLC